MTDQRNHWSEQQISELTKQWGAGKTAAAIGSAIGFSASAVTGKSRRLGLKPRPSPIIRDGNPDRPYAGSKVKRARVAKLLSATGAKPLPFQVGPVRECAWLDGQRFAYTACGAPTLPGRSLCEAHHRRCYTAMPKPTGKPFEFPK